jgi:Carboxypeptidase regulatory-like domain
MRTRWFLIYASVLLAVAVAARGQLSTSSLRGVALDPKGAAVQRVVVTIENAATGVSERTLTTDENGNYAAEALAPGTDRVGEVGPVSQLRAAKPAGLYRELWLV